MPNPKSKGTVPEVVELLKQIADRLDNIQSQLETLNKHEELSNESKCIR